jgi:hypothetical protein
MLQQWFEGVPVGIFMIRVGLKNRFRRYWVVMLMVRENGDSRGGGSRRRSPCWDMDGHTICSTIEGKSDGDFASLSLESHMRPARSNST